MPQVVEAAVRPTHPTPERFEVGDEVAAVLRVGPVTSRRPGPVLPLPLITGLSPFRRPPDPVGHQLLNDQQRRRACRAGHAIGPRPRHRGSRSRRGDHRVGDPPHRAWAWPGEGLRCPATGPRRTAGPPQTARVRRRVRSRIVSSPARFPCAPASFAPRRHRAADTPRQPRRNDPVGACQGKPTRPSRLRRGWRGAIRRFPGRSSRPRHAPVGADGARSGAVRPGASAGRTFQGDVPWRGWW